MLKKFAKTTLFTTIVASVLCAGAVSARQLRREAQTTGCAGRCLSSLDCTTGCVCSFTTPDNPGFCTKRLAGVVPGK